MVVLVVLVDQLSKVGVRRWIDVGDTQQVIAGVLQFTHVHNTGIAFGFFSNLTAGVLIVTVVVAAALAAFLWRFVVGSWLIAFGAGLIVGGGIGNVIDRGRLGYVTDFIQFPHWPTFNVADIAISCGIILIVIDQIRAFRAERREVQAGKQ